MRDFYLYQDVEGEVLLNGMNILTPTVDANLMRKRIGMVFQKPSPFPMSIFDNVAFGIRIFVQLSRSERSISSPAGLGKAGGRRLLLFLYGHRKPLHPPSSSH